MPLRWPNMEDINAIKQLPPMALVEIALRVTLFGIFFMTENMAPFIRVIQKEEFWLYKFPSNPPVLDNNRGFEPGNVAQNVSRLFSPIIVILSGVAVIGVIYGLDRKSSRAISALAVLTLALPLSGLATNIIKIAVGRPRPSFFSRCHGSRYMLMSDPQLMKQTCTGDAMAVMDGLKSFPSGHSSLSFCVMGFCSMYIASQLRVFHRRNSQGNSLRLITTMIPLVIATLCAISRTCDYHHHWQDVTVGSILGFAITYAVYRQYFPGLTSRDCHKAYPFFKLNNEDPSSGGFVDGSGSLESINTHVP